ncbi:cyanophycin synthetase [Legionella fairfieldensis]|uniref:cyanophycin synthetase n=1 Tax=Legionella fairfieldensis TaxID=45064 RepID=UPI00048AA07C|nr:cyanophycin synthetase [Legionella fairfieldensis]
MKIITIQVLSGPNYWSNYRKKLIVMKLDLEKYEDFPTNKLMGFNERLKVLLPSLYTHRCSPGVEGGFYQRLEEGTWLGHVIEHIALELQCLAGMDCGFGRTYSTNDRGVYHVIFAYEIEQAGLYAAEAAVRLVDALADARHYSLENDLAELRRLYNENKLGPSTEAIIKEAQSRNIPVTYNNYHSLITLGQGCRQKKIWATITSQTSSIGVDIAANKQLTKNILAANFIPVPDGVTVHSLEELEAAMNKIGFPLVTKPKDSNHGRGVSTNIVTKEKLLVGYHLARQISEEVIIEKFISGSDYRFLLVDYKVVAVAQRTPARIVGTGLHSVRELIDLINQDPRRGEAHNNLLTAIAIDEVTLNILSGLNLSLDSVLPKGKMVYLKDSANLSSGGTASDVTDRVHPANMILAERAARLIGLDICGIDVVVEDIGCPINKQNGAIIEVNAGPGLRMHLAPSEGKSRSVARPIIDMLFPEGSSAKIPVVAVTGTNGKTTVVRLIAHMAKRAHHYAGFTSTSGIYLDEKLIEAGDCSGPVSAKTVLADPRVDFAVLECARGGIARAGLGFDECDISIITNVSHDHLGLNDIHTLEELAELKGVVAYSTKKDGYAILNAEDQLVYKLKDTLTCNIALFAGKETSAIKMHCQEGGLAAYIEQDELLIQKGLEKYKIAVIQKIPLTFKGTASCMISNLLPAALAGFISGFSVELIRESFYNFYPTPEILPGRMNLFCLPHCQLMVDYAHNEGAFSELKNYLDTLLCYKKIGIIGAAGDRREKDIEQLGYLAACMFDELIIRHDQDGRGRTREEITGLMMKGIYRAPCVPAVKIISDGLEAIRHAVRQSRPDTFIFYAAEDVFKAIDYVKNIEFNMKTSHSGVSIL